MRRFKFNEQTYINSCKRVVRQVISMAQTDATEKDEDNPNKTNWGTVEWHEAVEDYSEHYLEDAIDDMRRHLTEVLSGKKEN